MENLLNNFKIKVNEQIFLKDPDSSELGKRIVKQGVEMINKLGFSNFTFRNLAKQIESSEASIYRYFENKHRFLVYLTSWYWGWIECRIIFELANIKDPLERLRKAILIVTQKPAVNLDGYINEFRLYNVVITESSKAYLTKEVEAEDKEGFFATYKSVVNRISHIITEINKEYKYPKMLITTVIEGAHHERYFADHLPTLTNNFEGEDSISSFYEQLVFNSILLYKNKQHGE